MKNKIVVLITVILSISIVVLISNNMKDNKEIKLTDMTENNISYSKEKINIYLFYGEGCPHCEELKNYLNSLDNKEKSYFDIYTFEVWNNNKNSVTTQVDYQIPDASKTGQVYMQSVIYKIEGSTITGILCSDYLSNSTYRAMYDIGIERVVGYTY